MPNQAVGGSIPKIMYYKAEGMLTGANDVIVLHPGRGFHFAVIEFKHGDNKLTPKQEEFQMNVLAAGGTVRTFWDDDKAAYNFWCWYVGVTERREF